MAGKPAGGKGDGIKPFEGGNDKQREHLNELVTAVNEAAKLGDKVTELEKLTEPIKGMERSNHIVWVNGVLVTKAFPSQTIAINA